MLSAQFNRVPHRRLNPLTGEWVLVSAHRLERPWQGRVEPAPAQETRPYDPDCYLCPGNARAGGARNPQYDGTFVFDNDYPALLPQYETLEKNERDLIVARSEPGVCRVVCFSPRHDLTLARMAPAELLQVVEVWTEQYCSLGAEPWLQHVQIFENRGATMGASNPHPHCQIWATENLPNQPQRELEMQARYRQQHGGCLLCDCLALEEQAGERVVCRNESFTVLVPFWAVWPFETLIIARRHVTALDQLNTNTDTDERAALADILKRLTTRYDNLFQVSFPYSMGLHQRPTDGEPHSESHLHAHFYPPLLRSATVQKFMVGFEMLGGPQRDLSPEAAAERLRELSETHESLS